MEKTKVSNYTWLFASGAVVIGCLAFAQVGCKPQTTSQKIEDKAEDAQHEFKQGVERTGENMERGADEMKKKVK